MHLSLLWLLKWALVKLLLKHQPARRRCGRTPNCLFSRISDKNPDNTSLRFCQIRLVWFKFYLVKEIIFHQKSTTSELLKHKLQADLDCAKKCRLLSREKCDWDLWWYINLWFEKWTFILVNDFVRKKRGSNWKITKSKFFRFCKICKCVEKPSLYRSPEY